MSIVLEEIADRLEELADDVLAATQNSRVKRIVEDIEDETCNLRKEIDNIKGEKDMSKKKILNLEKLHEVKDRLDEPNALISEISYCGAIVEHVEKRLKEISDCLII